MLITTCTHCLARFRVTPQQLNEKQGQVRCGRCRNVFSGFEALERFPDDDTGTRLLAAREAQTGEPTGTLESIEAVLEDIPAPPSMEQEPEEAPPEAPPAEQRPVRVPRAARPQAVLSLEPPPRSPVSRAWKWGAMLLFLVVAAEVAYGFRAPLAQRYPVLRPWLEAACAQAGCSVPWPREDGLLKLEDSELLEVPGRANEIALGARIRNLATFAQELPHIELTLTDTTGQAAVRRVLRPTDYLGRPIGAGEALPGGGELAIQLRLETPRVHPTGYELLLFYP